MYDFDRNIIAFSIEFELFHVDCVFVAVENLTMQKLMRFEQNVIAV